MPYLRHNQLALRLLTAPYSQRGGPSDANIYEWHKGPCPKKGGRQKYRGRNRQFYQELRRFRRQLSKEHVRKFKDKPCAYCRESYPYYAMDFDHRPGTEKLFEIADYRATRVVSTYDKLSRENALHHL